MNTILVLESDTLHRKHIEAALADSFQLRHCQSAANAGRLLKETFFHLILLDADTAREEVFALFDRIVTTMPATPVIVTSSEENTELVVEVMRRGAADFLVKPAEPAKLVKAVENALERRSLKNEIAYLRHEQDIVYSFDRIVAASPSMQAVLAVLRKFSATDSTLLLTGETGTGKSYLAGTVHFNSRRRLKPFVKINCANITETLLESELFGHERGAFTGADKLRIGRFEQAHGGTLFLDEIGEMGPSLQSKLLRVLEEKSFERVGGNRTIRVDARLIAATNRNLESLVAQGDFRRDLLYRINILQVELPPLRERQDCIPALAQLLLDRSCVSLRKRFSGFAPAALKHLAACLWPGNIRQLANTIERAAILEEGPLISTDSLSLPTLSPAFPPTAAESRPDTATGEKARLVAVLEKHLWIQKDAAAEMGISPRALNYRIRKMGITHPRWRRNR